MRPLKISVEGNIATGNKLNRMKFTHWLPLAADRTKNSLRIASWTGSWKPSLNLTSGKSTFVSFLEEVSNENKWEITKEPVSLWTKKVNGTTSLLERYYTGQGSRNTQFSAPVRGSDRELPIYP